jgi:hypothetical protein
MPGVIAGFADALLNVSSTSQLSSWHVIVAPSHEPLAGSHCGALAPSIDVTGDVEHV